MKYEIESVLGAEKQEIIHLLRSVDQKQKFGVILDDLLFLRPLSSAVELTYRHSLNEKGGDYAVFETKII